MAKITIEEEPKDVNVKEGEDVELKAKAKVDDGSTPTYRWKWDKGEDLTGSGADSDTYRIPKATPEHSGRYWVTATSGNASAKSSEAKVEISPKEKAEPILLWNDSFASASAWKLGIVGLIVLWPVWIIATRVISAESPNVSLLIAMQLLIIGVAMAMLGAYTVLLEIRGRSRTLEELQPTKDGPQRYSLGDIAKEIPEVLKTFGELKTHAALLVTAMVLFITAGVIAWKAIPGGTGSPGTSTPSPAPTVTVTTTL